MTQPAPQSGARTELHPNGDGDPVLVRQDASVAVSPARGSSSPGFSRSTTLTAPRRLQYLEALVGISQAVNATTDPNKVGEILCAHTAELLEVAGVSVQQVDDHGWVRTVASWGLSQRFLATQAGPLEENIAGRALGEGRTFAARDIRLSTNPQQAKAAEQEGIVSVACTPMFFAGRAVGTINVYSRASRWYTDEEFHVLALIAGQGGIALTNAGSYRALQAQTRDIQSGVRRVGEALSAPLDLTETLQLIVNLALDMTRAEAGAVFLCQDEAHGGGLRLSGMRGLDRRSIRRFRQGPASALVRRTIAETRVALVPDTRRLPDVAFPSIKLADDEAVETRSVVCAPLLLGNRLVGVLELYARSVGAFQQADVDTLAGFSHQATFAIERAQAYAQECHVAETLQRAFLPDLPPTVPGYQIGRIYAPGNADVAVGGDTYDLFPLPDGRVALVIADVTGNGVTAATLAVMVKYTVRAYAVEDPDPSRVLARLNEATRHQTDDSTYATVCYALLDPATGTLRLGNAAHPPALHYRSEDEICEPLACEPGIMAGFLPDQQYESITLQPQAGDVLVFYTDGVTEARCGKAQFGPERLSRLLCQFAHLPAQEIAAAIYGAVTDHTAGERTDDIALLVLKAD